MYGILYVILHACVAENFAWHRNITCMIRCLFVLPVVCDCRWQLCTRPTLACNISGLQIDPVLSHCGPTLDNGSLLAAAFETQKKSCRSSCLESQIINIKLEKNQQKVPDPPPKLSALDWWTCGNFQHWRSCWYEHDVQQIASVGSHSYLTGVTASWLWQQHRKQWIGVISCMPPTPRLLSVWNKLSAWAWNI